MLHVRQGITDRSSTCVANSVVAEAQRLQRVVLAVNRTNTNEYIAPISKTMKIKYRKFSGGAVVTYVKALARAVPLR